MITASYGDLEFQFPDSATDEDINAYIKDYVEAGQTKEEEKPSNLINPTDPKWAGMSAQQILEATGQRSTPDYDIAAQGASAYAKPEDKIDVQSVSERMAQEQGISVEEARRKLLGDALETSLSVMGGVATGGMGSTLGTLGRVGVQAGLGAAIDSGAGVIGNLIRGENLTEGLPEKAAIGAGGAVAGEALGGLINLGAKAKDLVSGAISPTRAENIVDAAASVVKSEEMGSELESVLKEANRNEALIDHFAKIRAGEESTITNPEAKDLINRYKAQGYNVNDKDVINMIEADSLVGRTPTEFKDSAKELLDQIKMSDQGVYRMQNVIKAADDLGIDKDVINYQYLTGKAKQDLGITLAEKYGMHSASDFEKSFLASGKYADQFNAIREHLNKLSIDQISDFAKRDGLARTKEGQKLAESLKNQMQDKQFTGFTENDLSDNFDVLSKEPELAKTIVDQYRMGPMISRKSVHYADNFSDMLKGITPTSLAGATAGFVMGGGVGGLLGALGTKAATTGTDFAAKKLVGRRMIKMFNKIEEAQKLMGSDISVDQLVKIISDDLAKDSAGQVDPAIVREVVEPFIYLLQKDDD